MSRQFEYELKRMLQQELRRLQENASFQKLSGPCQTKFKSELHEDFKTNFQNIFSEAFQEASALIKSTESAEVKLAHESPERETTSQVKFTAEVEQREEQQLDYSSTTQMASETFVQLAIPHLDGHYDYWSMLMENFLRSKEYWTVADSGIAEPALGAGSVLTDAQKTEYEGLKLKDLKAKNYLFQAIDRSILETILFKDNSKQFWDSMTKKYQETAKAKRAQFQALRVDFETLKIKMGESVSDYFSRTMAIANKMWIHGEKLEDVTIIEKILHSMKSKFNYVICSIEESKDTNELSIDEL
ncbi:hypothetical protein GH714_002665 [Hevea brasiliensis]|uniref:Uncharacterized protein n=1 Tax=Hevea brasiliensis TaxID=3981 RepID=A0A6A6LY38_HEVBR|nr:hypothetical protein GH714_002665 [Hevea brasiliensis]